LIMDIEHSGSRTLVWRGSAESARIPLRQIFERFPP
jgi:hypothetical protein